MKKRSYIFILVLLLTIGFASVATNLFINGFVGIGANLNDFDVIFIEATPEEGGSASISSDGKNIIYSTKTISSLNDVARLDFVISNYSTQYDADAILSCEVSEDFNDYLRITYNPVGKFLIDAQSTKSGYVTIELIKPYTGGDEDIVLTCSINAQAVSRENTAEKEVSNLYSMGGYLVDNNEAIKANKGLVMYSDTPHYVSTDSEGYFYVEGLEVGSHEIYYMGDKNFEELEGKSKEEIKELAIKVTNVTTNAKDAKFDDELYIKDFVIGRDGEIPVVTLNINDTTQKRIAINETISFNVEHNSNWTNILSTNGSEATYSNGEVNVKDVQGPTNVYLNESLTDTMDEVDSTLTNIYMLKSEVASGDGVTVGNNNVYLLYDGITNIVLNLNNKKITSTSDNLDYIIASRGKLEINADEGNIGGLDHSGYGAIISMYGSELTINNGTYNGSAYAVYNSSADVNINNGIYKSPVIVSSVGGSISLKNAKVTGQNGAYAGTMTISGGEYESFYVKKGILNINDEAGKVYIHNTAKQIHSIRVEDYDGEINITGHQASKTINGVTKTNEQVCTNNPNDFDSGICFYSDFECIQSMAKSVNIDGATFVAPLVSFWQVRQGNVEINNIYSKMTGDSCGDVDQAYCNNIRNHYRGVTMKITNSEFVNEHSYAIQSGPGSGEGGAAYTTIENTTITSTNSAIVSVFSALMSDMTLNNVTIKSSSRAVDRATADASTKLSIKGGLIETNSNTEAALNIVGSSGNVYISDGAVISSKGPAISILGSNGPVYVCNATLNGKYDFQGISGNSNVYYSNLVKFTNGTNTPNYTGITNINSNYTGTCLQ